MSRCLGCCQENCESRGSCSCWCHKTPHEETQTSNKIQVDHKALASLVPKWEQIPIPDDFSPLAWLCSCLDLKADSNLKVTRQGDDFLEILHKETGALFRFSVETLREPVK